MGFQKTESQINFKKYTQSKFVRDSSLQIYFRVPIMLSIIDPEIPILWSRASSPRPDVANAGLNPLSAPLRSGSLHEFIEQFIVRTAHHDLDLS